MVDTYRGQIRVRAWPRKRGPPKSEKVRRQNTWFKEANELAKVIEPTQQNLAIAMTLGTGLYPRDLILKQMSGGMYELITDDGQVIPARKRFRGPKVFQGLILQLTANAVLTINIVNTIVWPLPVLDTDGFWNAGDPTKITIPAGIDVVTLAAAWRGIASAGVHRQISLINHNGVITTATDWTADGNPAGGTVRGALVVAEGDTFDFGILCSKAASARGDEGTFFTLTVLQAA